MSQKKSKPTKNSSDFVQITIKESAIKNINFSVAKEVYSKDTDRVEMYKLQRQNNGFDDTETWHLDKTFSLFVIPRLKRYLEVNNGIPIGETSESYDTKIKFIIASLERYYSEEYDNGNIQERQEIHKDARLGIDYLCALWFDLWW
jgi:hypothetical protein